ncbi:unnamed protein product, partial [Toxocara canis]|uniref:DDE-1 domain-containing protein n=1 Tax=Toxocara canis TaxID=6265 RepID=A0A183UZN4_TOXCA
SKRPSYVYTREIRVSAKRRKQKSVIFSWFILKTPKDGAQTPLYLALSKYVSGVSGQYFSECTQKQSLEVDDWDKKCEQLYEYSLSACGLNNVVLKE